MAYIDASLNRFHDHPPPDYFYSFHHQQQVIVENNASELNGTNSSVLSNNLHDDEQCQICGDLASGWHCGAITCEACKKFFLRSISTCNEKKKYKCQRNLSCLITKRSRTQCQYCRFQKCLSVGMKAHVQDSPGSKTKDLYKNLPCLVCNAAASGIHFGAVTCEACKGFFRRSIKENAPERYHCPEHNNCDIISASKTTCRACRFRKCIEAGMSTNASRIGRQSNLFKENIRQLQNNSTSAATVIDSARVTSMAKIRKNKHKITKTYASNDEINIELSPTTKVFIEKVYNAYLVSLKDLPRCLPRETVWSTMAFQMINYAKAIMNFCQRTVPDFSNLADQYKIISTSINSIVMVMLLLGKSMMKSPYEIQPSACNYWLADSSLSVELNAHVPQIVQAENSFRSFESKLNELHLDEKEFALFLLMIITRHNLQVINDETKSWSKCQYECVQAFFEYAQARRSVNRHELPIEFYDVIFLVSQLRSLNHHISQCFLNLPWLYVRNLPAFFYSIFLPNMTNTSSMFNSNYEPWSMSPVKSSLNSTNRYDADLFIDSINSDSVNLNVYYDMC